MMRADALKDVASRLQIAQGEVVIGKDPRIAFGYAAQALEAAGYTDLVVVLRMAAEEFTEFLDKVRTFTVDGEYPRGVMDFSKNLEGADAGNSPYYPYHVLETEYDYDVVGSHGMGGLLTSTPPPSGAPPPALLDAASPSFPGGQGAFDPQPGGHGSGAAADFPGAVRRQGDPPPQQPVRLEIPALQRLDAEGDDVRRLLDVEPVQVVDAGEDATSVARFDVDPGTGTEGGRAGTGVEGINPAGRPEFSGSGAHWQVEVPGPGRLDPDTGASAVLGDYADVVHHGDSAVDGVSGAVHAAPPDTQAAVDAMPDTSRVTGGDYQTVAESRRKLAEGNALMIQLNSEYMEHQLDLNWPAMLAYGEALNDLRDDIFEVLVEFPKYTNAANGPKPNAQTAYVMLVAEVVKASQNAVAAGDMGDMAAVQRLTKFLDGFRQRMEDTLTNLGGRADEFEAVKTHSAFSLDPHIDQQKLAQWLDEREEDAARRMVEAVMAGDVDAQKAASQEMSYYQQMALDLKQGRNPLTESGYQVEYLRLTGQTEQADAYLGFHDTLMEAMSDPRFHKTAAEMGDATYAPVHFTRPDLGTVPTLDDTAVPAAVDNVDTDVLSAEVREPGGASRGDDGAQLDAGDYAANRDTINEQAGQGDYVHAPQDQPSGLSDDGYDRLVAQIDDDIDDDYGFIQRYNEAVNANAVDQRSLSQWDYRPPGTRSWKSPKQQGGGSVRFGDARQIAFVVELDVEETAKSKRGRPYRVATEPANALDVNPAVRQVPTPSDWKYWNATRQPGFGRTASVPGEFPFSVREQMLNALMQGKGFQSGTDGLDALEQFRILGDLHGYADWVDLLVHDLDLATLGKMLATLEAGRTIGRGIA